MTANNDSNELAALTAKLARLEAEVATLKANQTPAIPDTQSTTPDNRSSRRRMLKKLALSAAGVAAAGTALAAGTQSAAAASGNLPAGGFYAFPGTGSPSNVPTGSVGLAGSNTSSLGPAADNFTAGVYGYAEVGTGGNAYGVFGLTKNNIGVFGDVDGSAPSNNGIGVRGRSVINIGVLGESTDGYGGKFSSGSKSPIYLVPAGAGAPATTGRQKGELFVSNDATGKLYFFNGSAWVDLTAGGGGGGSTSGTLTFFSVPGRFLDSRNDANNFVIPGQPQVIPPVFPAFTPVGGQPPPASAAVRYKITGAASKGGGPTIPTTAKGIVGNITVVPNVTPPGSGYVVLWPDGGAIPATSAINYNSGQVVANSFVLALPASGIIDIAVAYPTSIIIDVIGWFN